MSDKPVTVAVISDTHVKRIEDLPKGLVESLARVDAVIHLGDYTSPEILFGLRKLGNFYGVIGNHDSSIHRSELRVAEILEIGGKRLGLIHGLFIPIARPKRIRAWFRKEKLDILLFGHNHLVTNRLIKDIVVFNPGTVTGQFPATQATFGMLTLDGSIKSEILSLDVDIYYQGNALLKVLAMIVRNGIRWLEAWPYLDPRPTLSSLSLMLRRISPNLSTIISRHKAD